MYFNKLEAKRVLHFKGTIKTFIFQGSVGCEDEKIKCCC